VLAAGCTWIDDAAYTDRLDQDGDGVLGSEDCDDQDDLVYPGAPEVPGDGIDQDCSGADAADCFADLDGDGYGSLAIVNDGACEDGGLVTLGDDCDDTDPATFPGAPELCDAIDQDCDGTAQGEVATARLRDGGDLPLVDDQQLSGDDVARIDLCGGTWSFDIDWRPDHGDLAIVGHDDFDRPTLTSTVVSDGPQRAVLTFDHLYLAPDADDGPIVELTGQSLPRPELVLHDVVIDGLDAGWAVRAVTADVRLEEVVVRDSTFATAAIEVEEGNLVVDASAFTDNRRSVHPDDDGGIVAASASFVEVTGSSFTDNDGRAMALMDSFSALADTSFAGNWYLSVKGEEDPGQERGGGALLVERGTANLAGLQFEGNGTDQLGGALLASDAEVTCFDCTFDDNGAPPPWVGAEPGLLAVAGGAVAALEGELAFTDSQFDGNQALLGGGSVLAYTDLTLSGVTFTNSHIVTSYAIDDEGNDLELGGHALLHSLGEAVLAGVEMTDFDETGDGACLRSFDSDELVLVGLTLLDCPARGVQIDEAAAVVVQWGALSGGHDLDDRGGGNLRIEAQTVLVEDTLVELGVSAASGGGAYLAADDVSMTDNTFRYNEAVDGGGVAVVAPALFSCGDVFEGNLATGSGAGVHASGDAWFSLHDLACDGPAQALRNAATGDGGGAWVGGLLEAGDLELRENVTYGDGGGAFVAGSVVAANTTLASDNVALGRGGGLFVDFEHEQFEFTLGVDPIPQLVLDAARFEGNFAPAGGGLGLSGSGWLGPSHGLQPVFSGTTFEGNAAYDGTAMWVEPMQGELVTETDRFDLADHLSGELVLDSNVGGVALERGARNGSWDLSVTTTSPHTVADGGTTCTLDGSPATLSCPVGQPCTCP